MVVSNGPFTLSNLMEFVIVTLFSTYHYSDILSDFHFFSSFKRRFRWDW
jgi:hypothetical protein